MKSIKIHSVQMPLLVGSGLIFIAAFSRLLPHPPNFSPIDGIALFSGGILWSQTANRFSKYMAFLIPLLAMLTSDMVLGFHATMPYVYGSLILMVLIGRSVGENPSPRNLLSMSLGSSILFFLITNFGYWVTTTTYAKNLVGLLACYVAALPFFHWTLISDLFFVFGLYGSFAFLNTRLERKGCRQEL